MGIGESSKSHPKRANSEPSFTRTILRTVSWGLERLPAKVDTRLNGRREQECLRETKTGVESQSQRQRRITALLKQRALARGERLDLAFWGVVCLSLI